MLRQTLLTLCASALLSAFVGATNSALAFPFGPPPGPLPGFAGHPPGLGGPLPGLAGPPRGLVGPLPRLGGPVPGFAHGPQAGVVGSPLPRTGLGQAGLGGSAARAGALSGLRGSTVRGGYGPIARYGTGYRHGGSRYGRWAREGLYGYAAGVYGAATSGSGYGTDGYSYSSSGCSYVYGYGGHRTAVCSDY